MLSSLERRTKYKVLYSTVQYPVLYRVFTRYCISTVVSRSVYCTQYITVQTVVLPITGLLSVSLNDTL